MIGKTLQILLNRMDNMEKAISANNTGKTDLHSESSSAYGQDDYVSLHAGSLCDPQEDFHEGEVSDPSVEELKTPKGDSRVRHVVSTASRSDINNLLK